MESQTINYHTQHFFVGTFFRRASTTNFWPYYYDAATGTAIDMESAGFEADAGGFEGYYYDEPEEAYYGSDLLANVTFGFDFATCDTICELVVPAPGLYVAKYTPPATVEVRETCARTKESCRSKSK